MVRGGPMTPDRWSGWRMSLVIISSAVFPVLMALVSIANTLQEILKVMR